MTLRIIIRTDDAGMAANVGGAVHTSLRSFETEWAELEAFLREPAAKKWTYTQRQTVGIELVPDAKPSDAKE